MELTDVMVTMRLYKGVKSFDEYGNITSKTQLLKLNYGRKQWKVFEKTVQRLGFTEIKVENCVDLTTRSVEGKDIVYKTIDTPDEILKSIENIFKIDESLLTPEQREIKELREMVKALSNKEKEPKKVEDNSEIEALRAEYQELVGKKPSHLMKAKGLKKAIEEAKQNEEA